MIRKLLTPLTHYPIHLNLAGAIHGKLTREALDTRLYFAQQQWNASPPSSRLDSYVRQYRTTIYSAPAMTASVCDRLFNITDLLFGNMSSHPEFVSPDKNTWGRLGFLMMPAIALSSFGPVVHAGFMAVFGVLAGAACLSYLSKGFMAAGFMAFMIVYMPQYFMASQLTSMVGAGVKLSILTVGISLGVLAAPWMGLYAAYSWKPYSAYANAGRDDIENKISDDIVNATDFCTLSPVNEIPQNLLFVTKDKFAFNLRDFATFNANKQVLINPYTRTAIDKIDCIRVYQHPSGHGRNLVARVVESGNSTLLTMVRDFYESKPERSLSNVFSFGYLD